MASVYDRLVSPESTDIGQIDAWLSEYLRTKNPLTPQEAYDTKDPFVDINNNRWHFWRDKFYRWCKFTMGSADSSRAFTLSLKRYGCEQRNVYFKDQNGVSLHCGAWMVPPGFTIK